MHISHVILGLAIIVCACIAVIFWGLNPGDFALLEEKIDLSDAVLTGIILFLLALLPVSGSESDESAEWQPAPVRVTSHPAHKPYAARGSQAPYTTHQSTR